MSSTAEAPALDMSKLNEFIGQFVTDLGAAVLLIERLSLVFLFLTSVVARDD